MQAVQTLNSIQPDLLIIIPLVSFSFFARFLWPSFHGILGTPFQKLFSLCKQKVLNSFSSLVSSLKSCSFFTTASHKRYFALVHCSAFPQPIHTHTHTSNCSKDLEICILHIKLLTTANKEPKQNRLPMNKNPTLLYLLLLKHGYVKCLRCFLV